MSNFLYTNGGEWIQRAGILVSPSETFPRTERADYTVYSRILPATERRYVPISREWNAINKLCGSATEVGVYVADNVVRYVVAGLPAGDFRSGWHGDEGGA